MTVSEVFDEGNLIVESKARETIHHVSSGLVQLDEDGKLRLVHLSLRDFLQNPDDGICTGMLDTFRVDGPTAHEAFGLACLDYFICLPTSEEIESVPADEIFLRHSLLQYAINFAPSHLVLVGRFSDKMRQRLERIEDEQLLLRLAECLVFF